MIYSTLYSLNIFPALWLYSHIKNFRKTFGISFYNLCKRGRIRSQAGQNGFNQALTEGKRAIMDEQLSKRILYIAQLQSEVDKIQDRITKRGGTIKYVERLALAQREKEIERMRQLLQEEK